VALFVHEEQGEDVGELLCRQNKHTKLVSLPEKRNERTRGPGISSQGRAQAKL
jgi:hypothetical protein